MRAAVGQMLEFGVPTEDAFANMGVFVARVGRPALAEDNNRSRTMLVSRFRSVLEERQKNATGHRGLSPSGEAAADMIGVALEAVKRLEERSHVSGAFTRGPHETDLGYPLTVIEALAFSANLTELLGLKWKRDTPNGQNFIHFAHLVLTEGYGSAKSLDFYFRAIQYVSIAPVDLGWVNEFIGTALTYAVGGGLHAYRKVPKEGWGYDASFSVRALPDPPAGKPLVVGLISDWGCGTPASDAVLAALATHSPDVVIHLGDVYYSGTPAEQREFWLEPMLKTFGKEKLLLQVPGNHDYYSQGGAGFFEVIDELRHQNASYFVLRGTHWQILALDTGLLNSVNLVPTDTMTFLTQDQASWAKQQLEFGKDNGLKTIMMSHHQLFSRGESVGVANAALNEAAFVPDELHGTYPWLWAFNTKSEDLPGNLPPDVHPAVNTRLLSQFPPELLEGVSAWYWGHEHANMLFKPYAGLERGRLIGNACIPVPKNLDRYATSNSIDAEPWGGYAETLPDSRIGTGDNVWNNAFATVTLDGPKATARYFELADKDATDGSGPTWGSATQYYEEEF